MHCTLTPCRLPRLIFTLWRQVETNLSPPDVLELLKRIEFIVGRVPSMRNGPRAVDLDVIFYDHIVFDALGGTRYGNRDLVIPHPRVQEREFVLRPLNEYGPQFFSVLSTQIKYFLV